MSVAAGALLFAACGSHAPRLAAPQRIESFCPTGQARTTSIESVVASTDDRVVDEHTTETQVRSAIRSGGGVIAHWNEQPVAMAQTSTALGETDGFVRVYAAAVPLVGENATSRPLYVQVRDHGARRWIEMRAYDAQNVCLEGRRDV